MNGMAEVLTAHQRHNSRSCLCGWDALGKSHPQHQEAMLTAAGFGELQPAQEVAWAKGATAAGINLMALQVGGINPNPYRKATP